MSQLSISLNTSITNKNKTTIKKKEKKTDKEEQEKIKVFEQQLNQNPDYFNTKNSLIANLDANENNKLKQTIKILYNKSTMIKENSFGLVPCPREGHKSLIYEDNMIVFGGDRNKMSFNDIYNLVLDDEVFN